MRRPTVSSLDTEHPDRTAATSATATSAAGVSGDTDGAMGPLLLDQVNVLRYATAPNAPTYRAIMQVCFDAVQRYVVELRAPDILAAVRASDYVVDITDLDELETQHLDQLVRWGNLAATHDSVGVDRLADFYHRRLVYHLTDAGEAAHRAIAEVERTIGRSGSLQTTMLVRIRDTVAALAADGSAGRGADEVYGMVHDLTTAFDTLTHEANRFVTDLGRLTGEDRDEATDDRRFALIKSAVLTYIQRFVDELRRVADDIRRAVRTLDGPVITDVLTAASRSADLPDFDGEGTARQQWMDEQLRRWTGIVAWFAGTPAEPATVDRLADFAVGAVLTLTRTLGRLNDQRGRSHGRGEDFLALARWFADCEDDSAAHRLWHAAFGLHGARHLSIPEDDPGLTSARTSWWDAAPVRVPTRLRSHGRVTRAGRTPRAADHTEERRFLAARARRERAQVEAATARFAGRRLRLSDLATLDIHEFDLLLTLLDTVLVAPRDADGRRTARTADGRLEVACTPPADGATCELTTPVGRLRCADHLVEVTDLHDAAAGPGSAITATTTAAPRTTAPRTTAPTGAVVSAAEAPFAAGVLHADRGARHGS